MLKRLLIVTIYLMIIYGLSAVSDQDRIVTICQELIKHADLNEPIFLDIRAGEWTMQLENEMRTQLLAKDADLRELLPETHSPASDSTAVELDTPRICLDTYLTNTANLYQISLDIQWQVIEHKRMFAYKVERIPKYTFTIKKILLPESRLLALDTYEIYGDAPETLSSKEIRLKWFDPIIASLAIGSLIYLLWTIE